MPDSENRANCVLVLVYNSAAVGKQDALFGIVGYAQLGVKGFNNLGLVAGVEKQHPK